MSQQPKPGVRAYLPWWLREQIPTAPKGREQSWMPQEPGRQNHPIFPSMHIGRMVNAEPRGH